MIINKMEFLDRAQLDGETLEVWIEEEWLVPSGTATELAFSEADLARAKLIRDLMQLMSDEFCAGSSSSWRGGNGRQSIAR
jgi:hypothetical protein